MNDNIQELTNQLIELCGNYIFPEYYSHTHKDMWKIKNPFTHYSEEKIVLSGIDEPMAKSLNEAIKTIKERKDKFFGK